MNAHDLDSLTDRQVERLWNSVDATGDCWEWTGPTYVNLDGTHRGQFFANGTFEAATRIVWRLLVGEIGDLELDHLCRNTICVNPDHLEPVTHRENILRGYTPTSINARKTHCKHGHPFDEDNTYMEGTWRKCRTCNRLKQQRWRERQAS